MSAQGSGNALALIRMGTPEATFSVGSDAQINGAGKDFAKSTYYTRLHRDLILANKRITYYQNMLCIFFIIHILGLYYPLFHILFVDSHNAVAGTAVVAGTISAIIICIKLSTLNKWLHKRKSTTAALNGNPLDQYVAVKQSKFKRWFHSAVNSISNSLRRSIARLQLLLFTAPALYFLYISGGASIIISVPLILIGIIFFSVIWPSKAKRAQRVDKEATTVTNIVTPETT